MFGGEIMVQEHHIYGIFSFRSLENMQQFRMSEQLESVWRKTFKKMQQLRNIELYLTDYNYYNLLPFDMFMTLKSQDSLNLVMALLQVGVPMSKWFGIC